MKNNHLRSKVVAVVLIGLLIVIDQAIKIQVDKTMYLGESIPIINNFFYITYLQNTGAAFSILEGSMVFFYLISIVAIGFFIYYFKRINFLTNKLFSIAITLMISGLIGNLLDRIFLKHVRDMFDFIIFGYDFAIFNFADVCLVLGTIMLIIYLIKEDNDGKNKSRNE